MQNSADFHRILDSTGKLIGVLDFNNMIPVRNDVVRKIEVKINSHDNEAVRHYKNLVLDQITFCQQHQETLVAKANSLYALIKSKNAKKALRERCLDWEKLEKILDHFQS